ncbi:MAG: hypothetical protein KGR69_14135 [Verrucomicrobia bacterium]|nr:hypothetical protein [Verrucomicrobiota bacterium]
MTRPAFTAKEESMSRSASLLFLACAAALLTSGCGLVATQVNRAANLLTAPLRAVQAVPPPDTVPGLA